MDDSERLRPCFCGHMPSWRWVDSGEKGKQRRWWIACDTCRFTGRLWPTQLEAVIAWDNRIRGLPPEELLLYNGLDARLEYEVMKIQRQRRIS